MSEADKKGYWVAQVEIADLEGYRKYIEANAAAFEKYGAKFLVRGGQSVAPEEPAGDRQVVIEFASYEQALACYHSPEYQHAITFRQPVSRARLSIIEGV